jgi:hypothetical protein
VLSYGVRPETAPELQYGGDSMGGSLDDDFDEDDDEYGFDEDDLADGYSSSDEW